jgi:hypothetical protein
VPPTQVGYRQPRFSFPQKPDDPLFRKSLLHSRDLLWLKSDSKE